MKIKLLFASYLTTIINNSLYSNVEMITCKLMEIINNFLSEFHDKGRTEMLATFFK